MLEQLEYGRDTDRFREVDRVCNEIVDKYPGAASYIEPPIGRILGAESAFYALHYRIPSQMAHAAFAGSGGVVTEAGIQFDSREPDANIALAFVVIYLVAFLDLVQTTIGGPGSRELLAGLKGRWAQIEPTLGLGKVG